ncbi:MAG TPA: serine protein kinase RIO, partial [Nitrososphaera sp.]|nr:serine protein kinase RIO [Nitrososphaera sp.]
MTWDDDEGDDSADGTKVVDRANRRYSRNERESRFLIKRSEDYQVMDGVFDMPTLMVIQDMLNEGILKSVRSHFATGKESKVYLALAPDGSQLAIKIFLTVSAEFKKRMQYIAGDPRFENVKMGSTRNMISIWAKKEFRNLTTAHKSGVNTPIPVAVKKNVLVMEFIGDSDGNAAPRLAEAEVSAADYDEVLNQMTILYQRAELIHADLSEYNIFKEASGRLVFFDFGSAVSNRHPMSKQFLVRDVINI